VLKVAVERANKNLAKRKLAPLPERITPHSQRRTFASMLYALGEDPGIVMDEMGHANPGLALRVYRQSMRRGEDEKAQLRALIEGREVADIGRRAPETASDAIERKAA
jgi:integrase